MSWNMAACHWTRSSQLSKGSWCFHLQGSEDLGSGQMLTQTSSFTSRNIRNFSNTAVLRPNFATITTVCIASYFPKGRFCSSFNYKYL